MSFSSISFLIFMVAVFILYWVLPHKFRWVALLAANVIFYASYEARFLLLILLVTLVSYFCAIFMERYPARKKLFLIIPIVVTVGFLVFYKYTGFILDSVNKITALLAIPGKESTLKLIQPLGISFFSFQIIGYMVDVYRGKQQAVGHLGKYAVFVSFFPNISSGPIERASHFLPQLEEEKKFDYDTAVYSLTLLLIGLIKKIIIADSISKYADAVFNNVAGANGWNFILGAILFSIQIYCDFSGYSDMAVGVAGLLGFKLFENFKQPYFATSIKGFWAGWHISLSTWLKDYIYIPLGGNRCSKARRNFNLMITFLVSGLWHGANWTYILWGGIHGLAQVIENTINEKFGSKSDSSKSSIKEFMKHLITLAVVCLAWVFFRANSVSDAFYVITHLFSGGSFAEALAFMGMSTMSVIKIAVIIIALTVYDFYGRKTDVIKKFRELKLPIRWIVYIASAVVVIAVKVHNGADASFIYFKF